MRTLLLVVICGLVGVAAQAQTTSAAAAAAAAAAAKPKIYISDSNGWQQAGGFKSHATSAADKGAPDSSHLNEVSAMASQCSTVEVTSDSTKATYILLWDTKAIWNALSARTNLLIMYTPKGDAVYSIRADSMSAAARHVCGFIATTMPAAKPAAPPAKPAS